MRPTEALGFIRRERHNRAVAAGAVARIPVSDHFYGYRQGRIEDPFGHLWIISTKFEDVSAEEMQRRMAAQETS